MDDRQKNVLLDNHNNIASQISDVKTVIGYLVPTRDLTANMVEEIMAERTHTDRVRALLAMIVKRPGRAFYNFCDALRKSGHEVMAEQLEKSYTDEGAKEGNVEPGEVEIADQAIAGNGHGLAGSPESMVNQPTLKDYQVDEGESLQ